MCSVLHNENDDEKEQAKARKLHDAERGNASVSKVPDDEKKLAISDGGVEEKKHHGNGAGSGENINLRAAMLHVLGDMVQSVGVVLAAFIIKFKVRI